MTAPNPIRAQALLVECPHCWASVGERCYPTTGPRYRHTSKPHAIRLVAAARLAAGLKNEPTRPKPKAWYQVPCPRCNADPGDPCAQVNQRGFIVIDSFARKPHAARLRRAASPLPGEKEKT